MTGLTAVLLYLLASSLNVWEMANILFFSFGRVHDVSEGTYPRISIQMLRGISCFLFHDPPS
jgi:hypothetical protein